MNQNAEQSILQTLTYFSVSSFPLTKEELHRYLWRTKVSWVDLEAAVVAMVAAGKIGERWGFYFLPGEEKTVEARREATVWSDEKIHIAKRAVRYIAWVPFLQSVLVCNSVGREVATKDSDIDVLVVAAPRRLWIVRFFTNFILRMFGLRTYGNKEAGRICLSFYITTDTLDLAPYRAVDEDIHFAYWLHQMVPVYDPNNMYEKMLAANTWTDELLPRRKQKVLAPEYRAGLVGRFVKRFFEIAWGTLYGTMVEKQAKDIQMMKLKDKLLIANQGDNGLVIQDSIIKLHEQDARASYARAWLAKQNSYVRPS